MKNDWSAAVETDDLEYGLDWFRTRLLLRT